MVLLSLAGAFLTGCASAPPSDWVTLDSGNTAIYLSWTAQDGRVSGNEQWSQLDSNNAVQEGSEAFTGTIADGKVTLRMSSGSAFTGTITGSTLALSGTSHGASHDWSFKPGGAVAFHTASAAVQRTGQKAQQKAQDAAAQSGYDSAASTFPAVVEDAQTALNDERSALSSEQAAVNHQQQLGAQATATGCFNSDAARAASSSFYDNGGTVNSLDQAVAGLRGHISSLDSALGAITSPGGHVTTSVTPSQVTSAQALLSRANAAAAADSATATADHQRLSDSQSQVDQLPYC